MYAILEAGCWLAVLLLFAFLPNLALGINALNERWGVAFVTERELRSHFRWLAKLALGLSIVAFVITIVTGSVLDAFFLALVFLTLAFRLKQAARVESSATR